MASSNISDYYFSKKAAGGLSGKKKLIEGLSRTKQNGKVNKSDIDRFYEENEAVRQFYGAKKIKKEHVGTMDAKYSFEYLHVDICDFALEAGSEVFRYLLVAVDCYSRYCFICCIASRETESLIRGFSKIIKDIKKLYTFDFQRRRSRFLGDGEFYRNTSLVEFIQTKGFDIKPLQSSDSKAFLAETTIKSFRFKVALIKEEIGSEAFARKGGWHKWVKDMCEIYNLTYMKKIKMAPAEMVKMSARSSEVIASQAIKYGSFKDWKNELKSGYIKKAREYYHQFVRLVLFKTTAFEKRSKSRKVGRECYYVVQVSI